MVWFVGALVLIIAIWLWRRGMAPAANDITSAEHARRLLQYLLNHGIDGAEMRIQVRNAPHHQIVFTKYVVKQNDVGLRSTYCEQEDQGEAFDDLLDILTRDGIRYVTSQDNGKRCVTVDYLRDISQGQRIAKMLFERAFAASFESDGVAYFKDVLISNIPRLTRVDSPSE